MPCLNTKDVVSLASALQTMPSVALSERVAHRVKCVRGGQQERREEARLVRIIWTHTLDGRARKNGKRMNLPTVVDHDGRRPGVHH